MPLDLDTAVIVVNLIAGVTGLLGLVKSYLNGTVRRFLQAVKLVEETHDQQRAIIAIMVILARYTDGVDTDKVVDRFFQGDIPRDFADAPYEHKVPRFHPDDDHFIINGGRGSPNDPHYYDRAPTDPSDVRGDPSAHAQARPSNSNRADEDDEEEEDSSTPTSEQG